ncbi:UDP-N-acetylmuramoyl-L-alanyl-D-glutamate--2,6-diaminopimelate ligase [Pikeienuella piscinae]|uniref:UDP-N-acetylmuramoyl-L-alanyl-D-glutamate--2,6-diaminopimelate ligase n=1 Tax=Pikeienuella piscinae TaxID=2748098 RepID=A0A7M3T6L7_9RHOB|nr:UDP-N-acetylmuramoyl-L-alanyl-D-glutamate--2,6-diaminopimelate ligase [Pikeienuella piscinae]QIE57648.1 UDP-N-acetylmuramoyl-L-alanyl-D-glutamate--2,6-diaminopimelate ligase [Pikeienuella piscinae]
MAATLASLGLAGLDRKGPAPRPDMVISGLCADSRETRPGFLFAALKGALDGAEFAQYAVRMGASAVLTSAEGAERARADIGDWPVPFLIDENPRRRLALAAAAFYGAQPETLLAVTGTNGKTSVASFARQIFAALGRRAASFGTVGVEGAVTKPLAMTTPEPITLHRLLAELADAGVTHAVMEASSHGLAQHRLDGARLSGGAFTNLSRDHLDYHADFESYLAAKLRLFSELLPEGAPAVLNADDSTYHQAARAAKRQEIIPFGRDREAARGLRLIEARFDAAGQELDLEWRGAPRRVRLGLIGGFQGLNAMAAAALVIGAGEAPDRVFEAMNRLTGVRGRMEHVATRANGAAIYVDYSHTPGGLSTALAALRLHTPGRLIVVFGAGGDRDRGKRPEMGRAACEGSDAVIVTDDNPRGEDPASIRASIRAACPNAIEIGDRAEAILTGVDALSPDDRLLIAGKGHETGQTVAGVTHPFDDAEQARASVAALDGEDEA